MADAFDSGYNCGYFKALLDVGHMLEWAGGIPEFRKSWKGHSRGVRSLVRLLLEDRRLRERFSALGGSFDEDDGIVIDAKTGEARKRKRKGGGDGGKGS